MVTVVTGFFNSTSGSSKESCFSIFTISTTPLGSSSESSAFRPRFLRIILRMKKAPISATMRTTAMAIPAMTPVPTPWEPLLVDLTIDGLVEVGLEGLVPAVSLDKIGTM